MSSTILSTKVLSPSQKSLALNAGLRLVEYNAIHINFLEFEIPDESYDALIFTSQNGVRAYLKYKSKLPSPMGEGSGVRTAFCVGDKTKNLLEKNGFNVKVTAQNARELGEIITKNFKELNFLWLTGNQRRHELPQILQRENIKFTELTVYETIPNPKKMETQFDGILFFSPSAVLSFAEKNQIAGTAFCIGNTTAEQVKKYTDNYFIAKKPTIENVLVQTLKYFNSNNQTINK